MKKLPILVFCLLGILLLTTIFQPKAGVEHTEALLGKLELARASQDSIFTQAGWHIWGADVIKVEDTYYMFYSRWPQETSMAGWLTHSEIALATASNAAGPFTYQSTVFKGADNTAWDGGMVHSPQILEYQDKYYLYYTASPKKPDDLQDADAKQFLKDNRRLGVAIADQPQGPWQRLDEPLIQTQSAGTLDSLAKANPAILEKPDGSFLLIYKGIKQEANHQTISLLVATSQHPLGPFEASDKAILDNSVHIEDPDIWYQDNSYYMIAHDVTGHYSKASDGRSLALFRSPNGFDWQATNHPLASRRQIKWADDTITYFQRFERPHILVEDGKASMVYVAVKEASSSEAETLAFNVAVPLELK